jgi:hypothetical protein
VRAPTITLATVGRWSNQLIAICGTVLPVSAAIASSASTTRKRCSSSTGGPPALVTCARMRLISGSG